MTDAAAPSPAWPAEATVRTEWAFHDGDTWTRVDDERRARSVGRFIGQPVASRVVVTMPWVEAPAAAPAADG